MCYLGECYLNLEDYIHSEYYYQKAIKTNKDNDTAWFGVGLIMWVEKKWEESIIFIRKAIKIDNSNSEYWLTLAKVYGDYGSWAEAEDALDQASLLEPENSDIWLTWADILMKFGKVQKSIKVMRTAMKENDDVLLKYRIAALLLQNKQEKEAFQILLVAMKQEFIQINYFFDIYPKALKNRRINKLIDNFRNENPL